MGSAASTTSSDDEEEGGDTFDLGPGIPSNYITQRREVRQRQAMARAKQQRGSKRARKPSTGTNNNIIMTGTVEDEDNTSVMTGMTGATGMHSLSSQATNQVDNTRVPISIGGGDDGSTMTGVSGATRKVANTGTTWRM